MSSALIYNVTISSCIQGELEHRRAKRLYGRTNKNQAIRQMTRHERRETQLLRVRRANVAANGRTTHSHHVDFSENDPLPYADTEMHHHISDSRRHYQDAFSFVKGAPQDPATKVRTCDLPFKMYHTNHIPELRFKA
jgi:hypothetical protein